ncbi:MAG: nucleotide pyrophosphohydrolase [Planctomycetota bacterium]|nr:MAG: nucleotide pyrophosphohydrolase [Planctomycetota bacterium]
MRIGEFQSLIESIYFEKDKDRGISTNFMWLAEEVGELSRALRRVPSINDDDRANLEEEFADVFAWLCTLASLSGVNMEKAVQKYAQGCPRCASIPCSCPERRKS